MAKTVLFEELHVTVLVPIGLAATAYRRARRTLGSKRFHARLRGAVASTFRQHASLRALKFSISL